MTVRDGLDAFASPPARTVAALGMFDGVHRGHQRLIATAAQRARRIEGTSLVVTFDPDPQRILDPTHATPPLMSLPRRLQLIQSLGVDGIWILPFTRRFSRMSAETFVRVVLVKRLAVAAVVVGENFAFGKDRRGDLSLLRAAGRRKGFDVVAVPRVVLGGQPISSSRIRRLISEGRVRDAGRLLGRPVELEGSVVRGDGRASELGFPTANIRLIDQFLPRPGVYGVSLRLGDRAWPGVMNLGHRPTFGPGPLVCEVHVLGFRGSLYGRRVAVDVLHRLRDERRFDTADSLARQMARDVARARSLLRV